MGTPSRRLLMPHSSVLRKPMATSRLISDGSDTLARLRDDQHPKRMGTRPTSGSAERGEFDILMADALSRLTRDQLESERVSRGLDLRGIRMVATADGYDSQTKTANRRIQRTASTGCASMNSQITWS